MAIAVLLVDHHVHRVLLFVDDDRLHVRRRQRADHELGRILRPQHDVDPLAGELVGHRVDARAAHADAGADRVDALVVRLHGDLGPRTGIARAALDLEQALLDLGHFLREQLLHELRRRARQHDLRAARGRVDAEDHRTHAVAAAQVFLGDHLAALQAPFDAPRLDDQVAFVGALHGADEDLVTARHEVVEQLLALGVADLLQDHLLGGLRADAADRHRIDRLLDVVVDLDVGNLLLGLEQQDLRVRDLQPGLVGHHVPTAEGLVVAGVAVDRHADVDLAAVQLLRGLGQRGFDGAEHDVAFDALLARDGVHQHQHFPVHGLHRLSCSPAPAALRPWPAARGGP